MFCCVNISGIGFLTSIVHTVYIDLGLFWLVSWVFPRCLYFSEFVLFYTFLNCWLVVVLCQDSHGGRHLQSMEKEKIWKMKQSRCKNKEIASRFGVSVHTSQPIKFSFPLESETKKKVKKPRMTEAQRAVSLALLKGYSIYIYFESTHFILYLFYLEVHYLIFKVFNPFLPCSSNFKVLVQAL